MLGRRLPSWQNRLIARNPNPGVITVSGRSFEALAVDETVLAFPAPLAERGQKPEAFEWAFAFCSSVIAPGWPTPGHGVSNSNRRASERACTA